MTGTMTQRDFDSELEIKTSDWFVPGKALFRGLKKIYSKSRDSNAEDSEEFSYDISVFCNLIIPGLAVSAVSLASYTGLGTLAFLAYDFLSK